MKFFVEIKRKVGESQLGLKVDLDLGWLVSRFWKASIVLLLLLPEQTMNIMIEAPNTILV